MRGATSTPGTSAGARPHARPRTALTLVARPRFRRSSARRCPGRCPAAAGTPPPPRRRHAYARENLPHVSIDNVSCARRHVPRISPATRRAPGHTRGVQSAPRRSASGTSSARSSPWSRKKASPLGSNLAGATGPGSARKIGSSRVRIHASPRGVRTAVSDLLKRPERPSTRPERDPRPAGKRRGRGGPEDTEVPAGELAPSIERVDVRPRDGPDRRQSRALPADHDRARRRAVSQRVGVDADRAPRLAVGHPGPGEVGVQSGGHVLGALPALRIVRQPPEREHGEIALRDHVDLVPRAPELDERRVGPAHGRGPLDPRVNRQERGPRHAVLQARPRRKSQLSAARGEAARRARRPVV